MFLGFQGKYHWMARTSSLNCLSCRNPHQTPHTLNCLPPFHWKPLFSLKRASSHPLPKNRLWKRGVEFKGGSCHDRNSHHRRNRQNPSQKSPGTAFCGTSNRRARCYPEPPKPSKPPKPSWRLPPLNSTPLFRHPEMVTLAKCKDT